MARYKNPENEQMAMLEDEPEHNPDLDLCSVTIRGAENVEGKPGFIVSCSYTMKPSKIEDDTPYEKRHQEEEYISSDKAKALKYVEEQLPKLIESKDEDENG